MKTQQRSFVVEMKSARRRLKTKPKSIWGDTNLSALVREAEATLPFIQNAVSNARVSRVDQSLEPESGKDGINIHEAGTDTPSALPSTGPDYIQRHQQDQAREENTVFSPADGKPKPKMARSLKRRRTSRSERADGVNSAPGPTVAAARVETLVDELALLDAENQRLKLLLAQHLIQQNAQLWTMIKRFEGA